MTANTAKFGLPYLTPADVARDIDNASQALAERVDYCLGETGENSITPAAANTKTTKVIAFSRTYKTPPRVVVGEGGDNASFSHGPGVVALWVDDVSTTDFTVACQRTNTTAIPFTYIVRPKSTDVTP